MCNLLYQAAVPWPVMHAAASAKKTTAAKKAAPARCRMSAAARDELSLLMKARWEARKKAATA